ncbi:MAG: dual-specificity RNA methyltransferase RlmN [Candidatus Binatia bacterium]|nr:MAG: dual-specificity RNA methyltransferase RlmN [Candidatus Binatia bacterium]
MRAFLAERGEPAYRAEQILRWIFGKGARSFSALTDVGRELREALAARFDLVRLEPERVFRSVDGTRKLVFRSSGGDRFEAVLIPDRKRLTLCVSSQVGCAMGCKFCATARLGLRRQLAAEEIVAQYLAARDILGPEERITNVVFMGMGEPLHNLDAVLGAIRILTAPWGPRLASRRITVSTVGLVPGLERLVRETRVQVAVSLFTADDATRGEWIPANRRYPVEVLLRTCRALPIPTRRRITFECVLLRGVNDSEADAERLAELLRPIRCKVNLIPFNSFPGAPGEPPSSEATRRFQEVLLRRGIHATVRASRGRDIGAACGQLAGSLPAAA